MAICVYQLFLAAIMFASSWDPLPRLLDTFSWEVLTLDGGRQSQRAGLGLRELDQGTAPAKDWFWFNLTRLIVSRLSSPVLGLWQGNVNAAGGDKKGEGATGQSVLFSSVG